MWQQKARVPAELADEVESEEVALVAGCCGVGAGMRHGATRKYGSVASMVCGWERKAGAC
jgi:ribose 5-phosphate isomerase RpiB